MVVAGTVATMRVTGVPSGYPAEQEANIKVRFVDDALEVMSDYDAPLLKAVGGIAQFVTNNTKHEWVLGDTWSDRGLISGSHDDSTTTLTLVKAIAHRFPRGAILKIEDELVRVLAAPTTSTLTILRGYAGSSAAAHASSTEFRLVGFTETEGTTITFRGSELRTLPYNYHWIFKTGAAESWAQTEANVYSRQGATIPETMANTIKEFMVAAEASLIEGERYEGTSDTDPSWAGGLRYFGTSANGATVIDCGGAKLSRAIMNEAFDGSFNQVGQMNMARTVLCGVGAQRILWEEYKQPTIRTSPTDETHREGFSTLMNEYGTFNFVGPYKRIPTDELWIVNTALIEVGHYGNLGRLHEFELPTNGDYNAKGMYGMYTNRIKGIPGLVRVHNFTTE